jgi:mediator of RNA polymerase II transcription subunit 21
MAATLNYVNYSAPWLKVEGQPEHNPREKWEQQQRAREAAEARATAHSQAVATQSQPSAANSGQSQQSPPQYRQPPPDTPMGAAAEQINSSEGYIHPEVTINGSRYTVPDSTSVFESTLQTLAQDLVIKEKQVEALIDSLPGIGQSERAQEARMKELEEQLREAEIERRQAVVEKETLLRQIDDVIGRVRRF